MSGKSRLLQIVKTARLRLPGSRLAKNLYYTHLSIPDGWTGCDPNRKQSKFECFYEKVIKVKADVAALLTFLVLCGFRHISAENFALGSLRSDDWQLGRPTAAPLLSVSRVISPPNASSLPCCIDPVVTGGAVKGARKGRSS